MKNKLEEFVNRNRESFDSEAPERDLFKNIEATTAKPAKKILYFFTRMQAAASLLVLVNAAILFFLLQRKPEPAPANNAAHTEQATGTKEPTQEETLDQISKVVEIKQAKLLEIKNTYPVLYKKFTSSLDQLNNEYENLEKELDKNPNKEQLLEAMIQNLSLQQELLNQQLLIYQKIKQTKNEKVSKNI
jgi:hypothetical protein